MDPRVASVVLLLLAAAAAGCVADDGGPSPAASEGGGGPDEEAQGNGTAPAAGNGTPAEPPDERQESSGNGTSEEPANGTANETTPLPADLAGYEVVRRLDLEGSPAAIHVDEAHDVLLVGRGPNGLVTFDVSSPGQPVPLGRVLETADGNPLMARSLDLLERDGTPYAVVSGGQQGIHVVDLTDPADPRLVATASRWPSHHLAAVPGTPYVYDAHEISHFPFNGAPGPADKARGPVVPVLDLSNVTDPSWTTFPIPTRVAGEPVTGDGCHHVSVRVDLGQAYCAGGGETYGYGGGETFIWNISANPADPSWLGVADHPAMMYHHQALAGPDGDLLLVSDESLGPNCQRAPGTGTSQPVASVWVFDISDPTDPKVLSHVQADSPPEAGGSFGEFAFCSSHLGEMIGDRRAATWSWWSAGTVLLDFSDPADPTIVDRFDDGGVVRDARYHDGHVYTGAPELAVLRIVGEDG